MSFVYPTFKYRNTQYECQIVLFDLYMKPYLGLSFQLRVDLRAKAIKGYYIFLEAAALLESNHHIV